MTRRQQSGFTLIEVMVSLIILLGVSAIVMTGMTQMMRTQGTVANRTEMHTSVRAATELLEQEVGQAGKMSLPSLAPPNQWVMLTPVAIPPNTDQPVTQLVQFGPNAPSIVPLNLFDIRPPGVLPIPGEQLVVDTGQNQEIITLACPAGPGNCPNGSLFWSATFINSHNPLLAPVPIRAPGAFSTGVVPPAPGVTPGFAGYPNGSTGAVLKLYGDINGDGNMVYVEYTCVPGTPANPGFLYRNSMPLTQGFKPPVDPSMVVLNNVVANPNNPNGTAAACFTYQVRTVGLNPIPLDTVFVTDVAITLTVQTQIRDPQTQQFQQETKALLNVSPRNVFDALELAQQDLLNRVQPMPLNVKNNLLPGP